MKNNDHKKSLSTNVGQQLYQNVIGVLTESAWAITPSWLDQIHGIVGRKIHGIELSEQMLGEMEHSHEMSIANGKAIIPVKGPLFKKANMMTQFSGATSMEIVGNDFKAALTDDSVESIVFLIGSPGGTIDGTKELADLIFENRGEKPITAYVDGMAASAAYWIASAADEVIASSETALIGSVGVIMAHYDYSKYYENEGVKKKYIYQGKYKGLAREAEPLSKEGEDLMQGEIDGLYEIFVESIAKNLGISVDDAKTKTADSKIFNGKEALERGLVHKIGTLESIIGGHDSSLDCSAGTRAISTNSKGGDSSETVSNVPDNLITKITKEDLGNKTKTVKEESMDLKELKSEYPEHVSAIQKEAREGYVSAENHSKISTQLEEAKGTIGTLETEGKESTKKIALMETAGAKAVADSIQDGILAESDLPEKIHAKTKKMVDFNDHLKEGETFTKESESGKAFAAVFQAEVDDWEKSLEGSDTSILGGDGKKEGSGSSTEAADIEDGKRLARKATGTCRSDEEG
jgi:signal peptide peptidase SppA